MPNYYALMATSDGGVIAQTEYPYNQGFIGLPFYSGPAITFDANGNQTGQLASLSIQSWRGNAYRLGSTEQYFLPAIDLPASFSAFAGTNASGVGTAVPQPWFPLMTCTDKALNLSCPQAGDLIWNAYKDVTAQLNTDSQCKSKAQNLVFSKFTGGDANGYPITSVSFVSYISHQPGFYDGTKSTTPLGFALCGEGSFSFQLHHRANCNGAWGVTIKDDFSNLTNTVDTVTPSYPFKSFWRPSYTPPAPGQIFGIGIDPSNNGVNISNESNFFHEALHGMTGLYDDQIQSTLGIPVSSDTSNISLYIRDNVLSQCPTFR